MRMQPVSSTDIARVGYENNILYIQFNTGSTYSYQNVPESIYMGLLTASSHGKFFHNYIKNNYSYTKIG